MSLSSSVNAQGNDPVDTVDSDEVPSNQFDLAVGGEDALIRLPFNINGTYAALMAPMDTEVQRVRTNYNCYTDVGQTELIPVDDKRWRPGMAWGWGGAGDNNNFGTYWAPIRLLPDRTFEIGQILVGSAWVVRRDVEVASYTISVRIVPPAPKVTSVHLTPGENNVQLQGTTSIPMDHTGIVTVLKVADGSQVSKPCKSGLFGPIKVDDLVDGENELIIRYTFDEHPGVPSLPFSITVEI